MTEHRRLGDLDFICLMVTQVSGDVTIRFYYLIDNAQISRASNEDDYVGHPPFSLNVQTLILTDRLDDLD